MKVSGKMGSTDFDQVLILCSRIVDDSCSFQICNVPLSNETSGKFYTESLMEKSCGIYGIHLGIVMVSNVSKTTLGVENCRLKRRGGFDPVK